MPVPCWRGEEEGLERSNTEEAGECVSDEGDEEGGQALTERREKVVG